VTRGTDIGAKNSHFQISQANPIAKEPIWVLLADGSKVEAQMKYSSARSERLILADPLDSRLRRKATAWDRISAALNDPELIAIVLFCTLGLLATLGLYLLAPGLGALAASLQAVL
jgi:hypothetical protein